MNDAVIIALVAAGGVVATAAGGVLGAWIGGRAKEREAAEAAKVAAESETNSAQHQMIDQLQEELARYRERTDKRLDSLEQENRGYRAFIGVQRDHMAEHKIPLPPWPDGLPR